MNHLTPDRREALQEMINIGFGRSIASLAELLNVHINLSVPDVQVISPRDLLDLLTGAFPGRQDLCLVHQAFRGQFFGEAVLVLPGGAGRELMAMLGEEAGFQPDLEMGKLEMEALLEIGNLVMGACLGQFADLLQTTLSFNPPALVVETASSHHYLGEMSTQPGEALLIKTNFLVELREVMGYLLIFLHQDCLDWLFQEVDAFLEKAIG